MSEFRKPASYKSVSASETRNLPKEEEESREKVLENLSKMIQNFWFGNSK